MISDFLSQRQHDILYITMPIFWGIYFFGVTILTREAIINSVKGMGMSKIRKMYYLNAFMLDAAIAWFLANYLKKSITVHEIKLFIILFLPMVLGIKLADIKIRFKHSSISKSNQDVD